MDLYHYFMTQKGRNIIKCPHFFPIYERHFRRFVGQPITFLEIGTGEGGSSQMWKYYFGPRARIVSIDIRPVKHIEEEQILIRTGDQSDERFLSAIIDEFGPPDIVCDDGSHMMEHINATFDYVFPRIRETGVYLVEDLDGAYWPERGGGFKTPSSFVERAKQLVDNMNAGYTRGEVEPGIAKSVTSISFYPMVVVFEKSPYENRLMVRKPDAL